MILCERASKNDTFIREEKRSFKMKIKVARRKEDRD